MRSRNRSASTRPARVSGGSGCASFSPTSCAWHRRGPASVPCSGRPECSLFYLIDGNAGLCAIADERLQRLDVAVARAFALTPDGNHLRAKGHTGGRKPRALTTWRNQCGHMLHG